MRPILLLLPALAVAVEVEAAKLATPDAMPLDPGSVELALGLSWARSRDVYDDAGDRQDRGGTLAERTFEAGATLGIREGLDAGITLGWAHIRDDAADPDSGTGPTDITLGAKWQFFANETAAVALLPELSIPVGDGRPEDEISTGSEEWGIGLTVAATVAIERLALGAAIGRGWILDDGDERGAWAIDIAAGWQLSEAIQPEIELHHARDVDTGDAPEARQTSVTLGMQLSGSAGRLGLGIDRVIAGQNAERATTLLVQAVTAF